MIYEKRTIPHAAVGTDAYGFFCILKTTRWASGSKEAAADEEK